MAANLSAARRGDINICLGNHNEMGVETLRDLSLLFAGALGRLGYNVQLSLERIEPGALNIFIELFGDAFLERHRAELSRVDYGVICTEQFDGARFRTATRTQMHLDNLYALLPGARFVWSLDAGSVAAYAERAGRAKTFHVPLGYDERLTEFAPLDDSRMQWDVAFMGRISPYRQAILDRLAAHGLKVFYVKAYMPAHIRISALERARIHLALRMDEAWEHPSPMRIAYLLANDCCVVSERCKVDDPIEDFTVPADADGLFEVCSSLLQGGAWRVAGTKQGAAFRQRDRMSEHLRALVPDSFRAVRCFGEV